MATFTITTAVNIDTLASKAGSDTYTINGGYLTVDQHTRYGTNQNTSAAMGNLTLSATLGGTVEFNSTNVRLIPYNTGTSTVPALGTTISKGSASGKLLAVYSALNVAPTTAGGAMPASGYILIRQWNGTHYTTGSLTGISASATSADGPGWLEIVGTDALVQTTNRLGTYKVRGDWYDFQGATTTGTRTTQYQCPTNGSNFYAPGVEVETANGSGVYEFYPNAGTDSALSTTVGTDAVRGRWCWITNSGLVSFGYDSTNSTGGYCPPSGRKIRIPNIFFMNCASADKTVNTIPNATLATRMEFAATGGGVLDFDKCCMGWYMNINQPFSVALTNVYVFDNLTVTECASAIAWSNVGIGQSAALSNYGCLMSLCFAGGTMDKCTWTRAVETASSNYCVSWTDLTGFTITNERIHGLSVSRGNAATGSSTYVRNNYCSFTDCLAGAGKLLFTTCSNVTDTSRTYYDHPALNTITMTGNAYCWELSTNCSDMKFDGLSFGGLNLVQPFNGILSVGAAGCTRIKLRNLGTYASPLDLGGSRVDDATWTRVTTTATVTSNNHGMVTGDTIYIPVSSNSAALKIQAYTLTGAPDANTFTFTCTSSGSTSGTISYFPTKCANVVVFANAAAANDVKIQRCYVPHTRTNLFTADNSSKNIVFENVISDFLNAFTTPLLNSEFKGVSGTPTLAAQTSVYGTHWLDVYNADVSPNLVNQNWSRSGTTVTVTSVGHSLRTGLLVNITASDNIAGVPLGIKSITAVDSATFTFTGVNSGSTSGQLTYRTVIDRIVLMMNEATAESSGNYADISGATAFTSAGGLFMPNVSDTITFSMPYYRLGPTGFPAQELAMGGGTIANYWIQYQLDINDGNGYGGWHNAYYARTGGSGTSGQYTFTVTDATGVESGDYVFGTGISGYTKVTDVTSNTITVDNANVATVSGTIRFAHLRTDGPTVTNSGIKIKLKITTMTANATAMSSITIYTDTDDASRSLQYTLDLATLTINNPVLGSRYEIYNLTTSTQLTSGTIGADPTTVGILASAGDTLRVRLRRSKGVLLYVSQTANFGVGNILTGNTSGASAIIGSDSDSGSSGTLTLENIVGIFQDSEIITDDMGGSATASGTVGGKYVPYETNTLVSSSLTASVYASQIIDMIAV